MDKHELITKAAQLADEFRTSKNCTAGSVAAAVLSASGQVYTGICFDVQCGIGFCAEHAAVSEMLKSRESEVQLVVAVNEHGEIIAPCGRCRELLWQINPRNATAEIILGPDRVAPLRELLPQPERVSINKSG